MIVLEESSRFRITDRDDRLITKGTKNHKQDQSVQESEIKTDLTDRHNSPI